MTWPSSRTKRSNRSRGSFWERTKAAIRIRDSYLAAVDCCDSASKTGEVDITRSPLRRLDADQPVEDSARIAILCAREGLTLPGSTLPASAARLLPLVRPCAIR